MTPLLANPRILQERAGIVTASLAPLAGSLRDELLAGAAAHVVPRQKATLSREGGRCPVHGTYLEFDPMDPGPLRCLRCARSYGGEWHDRFRPYWQHMWVAERAVHGALLAALGVEPAGARMAADILRQCVERYSQWPNADNVLGPSRPFFSTYLESIWLLQVTIALDLLEMHGAAGDLSGLVRDRIVEPGVELIASYDESGSNRQVWNNGALLGASRLLDRPDLAALAVDGASGIHAQLASALLPDGTWYEGDNYHLFAHRGLWYAVRMMRMAGMPLRDDLVARYRRGFVTPFLAMLPDGTLPSRRDSQYAVSVRQWRLAEHAELGLAEDPGDERLRAVLAAIYADDLPRGDTGRWRSTAEVERNEPASALSRADLGWRSLLAALPELPRGDGAPLPSVLLPAQGYAVIRRDEGRVHIGLDYGQGGGGHGHPDRLNMGLATRDRRWLEDVGTGSYVDRSLFWYRSTLAHNAPMVDGRSQPPIAGQLVAWEDRGAAGWMVADAAIAPGWTVRRALVALPDYLLDHLEWAGPADAPAMFDLPIHLDATVVTPAVEFEASLLPVEDAFEFIASAERARLSRDVPVRIAAEHGDATLTGWLAADVPVELWRVVAPGPPGEAPRTFLLLRAHAASGRFRIVWDWSGRVTTVAFTDPVSVSLDGGERHVHAPASHGWHIDLHVAGARSSIDLEGLRSEAPEANGSLTQQPDAQAPPAAEPLTLSPDRGLDIELGEADYRRSEQSWDEAGRPEATVGLDWDGEVLACSVDVRRVDLTFAARGADNPLDNEEADINGAGAQLYLIDATGRRVGVMLVPDPASDQVRIRAIAGWSAPTMRATWSATSDGWRMLVALPIPHEGSAPHPVWLDLIINEKPAERARRRGQLLLSGAGGEFIYLRGDRHDASRLIPVLLHDV